MFFSNDHTIINQHYIILSMIVFVGQKWSNEFPEKFICNNTFLGNILKKGFNALSPKRDTFIYLRLEQKFIFFGLIFPKLVFQRYMFIYFFPKFFLQKAWFPMRIAFTEACFCTCTTLENVSGIVFVDIVKVNCNVRIFNISNEEQIEQTKDETDLTLQEHEIELKGADDSFVIPEVAKTNIDSYVDQVTPHIKVLIENGLKKMQSAKVIRNRLMTEIF